MPGPGRAVTTVQRDGVPVAALIYDRSLDDDPELIEAVGGAATIALENRALQAEAQARLAELQASRERIVTAADAERRRIERNLHDGAQQRLVTLALQLSLIRRRIRDDPERRRAAGGQRERRAGAAPWPSCASWPGASIRPRSSRACPARSRRSPCVRPCPRGSSSSPVPRWPQPVEFAAYFVASEALANAAKHADASAVTVRVPGGPATPSSRSPTTAPAAPTRAAGSGLRGLADRVEALGGRFRVGDGPAGGTVVTAELPLQRHDR